MLFSRGYLRFAAILAVLISFLLLWQCAHSSWRWQRARAAIGSSDPRASLAELEQLRQTSGESAELAFLLAVANRRAGQTNVARECLEEARRLGWSANDLQREEHLLQFQSGDTEQAEQHLLALLGGDCPNDVAAEVYECLVMGYLSAMRLGDAKLCLDYWAAWQPDSIVMNLMRADIYRTTRDRLREVTAYEAILKVDSSHFRATKQLADAYLEVKDVPAALKNYQKCAELRPDDPSLLVYQAICHRRLGEVEAARQLLSEATTKPLDDVAKSLAFTEMGQLALSDKEYERAVDFFQQATQFASLNSSAEYALGLALARLGKQEEADAHIERSQEMDADYTRYVDLVGEIMSDPTNPQFRCQAGLMALDGGARKEAFSWLQSALRCDPTHAETHEALARYYREGGREDLAAPHLALAGQTVAGESAPQAVQNSAN
ncbi:MAG TPA: tetratricopeptide repeat protein [Pirellulales bacterium]|nr:tetratricopeptide repeat protein [Pirellulales bacterium]